MRAVLEDARQARPSSVWFETTCSQLLVERTPWRSWVLWHTYRDGRCLDSFERKRDAMAVAAHMAEVMPAMDRIVEIDEQGTGLYGGPDETERKRLVVATNDAYLEAKRGLR